MDALAYHRDREARHDSHFKIDCLASAPSSVKDKSRRSRRAAGKAATRNALLDALEELAELRELGLVAS
jgi:hypothetical protein